MRRTILALALMASAAPAMAQMPDAPPPPPPGGPVRAIGAAMLMRADANGDGVITRDEAVAQSDMRFDRMDGDHDGTVSQGEMRASRESMRAMMRDRRNADGDAPPPPPPPAAGRDRGPPPEMTRGAARARAIQAFDRVDANHDGRVDRAEMARLRDRPMPPPVPQQ